MNNKHTLIPPYVSYAGYKDRFKQTEVQFYIFLAVSVYAK